MSRKDSHEPGCGEIPDQSTGLPLGRVDDFSRTLSLAEYYHACIGMSPKTIEPPREAIFVLNGHGTLTEQECSEALQHVALRNPGLRLRVVGDGRRAAWRSDGLATRLRVVEGIVWDGRSEVGSEFIYETSLNLCEGPATELILVGHAGQRTMLVFRALHAVMDGRGVTHFLHELFRAFRREPLHGTNVSFSDTDLMKRIGDQKRSSRRVKTISLTGGNQGVDRGDTWRRLTLPSPQNNVLARVAGAAASFAHLHAEGVALMAIPVDLRRHMPRIESTMNYSSVLTVPLNRGEGAIEFKKKLHHMLDNKMETRFHPELFNWLRLLPLHWFDRLASRTPQNYLTKRPFETALISNLGRFDLERLCSPAFRTDAIYCLPLGGNACFVLSGTDTQVEITVGLSRLLAANGRLDHFMRYLDASLAVQAGTD